ncbi:MULTISPECIES: ABC transporter ATP-binding protein [Bradyrhizobium]|uniref:ABC transporter ATP-binding protein n=1 Tax=Bradyrhizobium TaxID=374 RepID=UPI00042042E8|nr:MULTISPECIES: ABC transporter ATP-binding protein [Bradyrhizobium]MBR0884060.1 ABC transporter ATP-binding protein [Bradyrhizobium liaoningense]MBR0947758.1 ABC transporter ATP-binding protein [Bradyrhizobium liaoningense]MBR1004234.1 ABC transporter ATP-binding protein [Bradyrhizobium liaoningense]MBR1070511.1 ABC transporter ATP-binding protein [Bradyrhizobium liaoningense]WLC03673.1 ABC transporter ATP-binding protein [Bradyrhizobium japonicum USDA 123]
MTRCGIRLDGVNLQYSASAFNERSLKALFTGLLGANARPVLHDVHALKNICVEIVPGERVGLLGHNGAGKSTFLKMVAGLYPISSGFRYVDGTVRSLFDLSLGFEPDATGRENILYRGLLLGLTPSFMRSVEEQIVAFADVGEFIDYPIKTYSAGMQVRLAFAISTIVGGDILLLDEVIGAGDATFMQRAKTRILELIDNSEILLLASHDLGALRQICERALVLDQGEVKFDGPVDVAVEEYKKLTGASL